MGTTWWVSPEELNDEQVAVVDAPVNESHLVLGPPGSGKTNLLLLRANYLWISGKKNICVVVFTRALREFIEGGAAQYDFPSSRVMTYDQWARDYLHQFGAGPAALPEDFDERRALLTSSAMECAKLHGGHAFDAILLDETQDFTTEECRLFRSLAHTLVAVADSRQKIYKTEDPRAYIESVVGRTHQLTYHYRSGLEICKFADAIAKPAADQRKLVDTVNYDERKSPSKVELHRTKDADSEFALLLEGLTLQCRAYPDEPIGVLCPKRALAMELGLRLLGTPLAPHVSLRMGGQSDGIWAGQQISVSTIHSAKGLEFRAVHLLGCDQFSRFPYQRNLAYTAVTRAKTRLTLYTRGPMPGFLEAAAASLGPPPQRATLRDAFGGGA